MAKSKRGLAIVFVVVVLLVLLVSGSVRSYNGLVQLQENVQAGQSQVETQLQRRADLIPNLVNTVKGYAAHEEEIFTAVADARSKLLAAGTVGEQAEADQQLTSALSRLLALTENYPDLKANQNFIALQDELAGTENRIAVARKDYNTLVREYNATIKKFPKNLFAGMFGFEAAAYYQADQGAQDAPNVEF